MNVTLPPENHIKSLDEKSFDLEKVLPLELIREHTKTDDVMSVSDFQLTLYRQAALEAAQIYTKLMLFGRRVMWDEVHPPIFTNHNKHNARYFTHEAESAFAERTAWFYGLANIKPVQVKTTPGTTLVRLPRSHDPIGSCCDPCGSTGVARLQYVSGFESEAAIPALIKIGTLKYIAHLVENPGDLVITSSASGGTSSGGSNSETANPALASGALDIWRSVVGDAI